MTAPLGCAAPLYLLPFDHRHSYLKGMFHFEPPLDDAQHAKVADNKRLVYEGFCAALDRGVPTAAAGILVDEEFGADILREAANRGVATAVSVETSGSDEFDFEYGDAFAEHLKNFRPTLAKVLVHYNVDGDAALNARQLERLARLSRWCRGHDQKLMFELVSATKDQLASAGGEAVAFDRDQRPDLMIRAIGALQDGGVDPDVWKIEGLDWREDCERVVAAARAGTGRSQLARILLGRGRRGQGGRVADYRGTGARLRRLRGRPDQLLRRRRRLRGRQSEPHRGRRPHRRPLLRVGRHLWPRRRPSGVEELPHARS